MMRCFHCAEPVNDHHYGLEIKGIEQWFCCPGCKAVAETILGCGLASYYEHRTAPGARGELIPAELAAMTHYDLTEVQQDFVTDSGREREIQLSVEGITCAACAWLIERHLFSLPGVRYINVNTTTHRARVRWDPERIALSELLKGFAEVGYRAYPFQAQEQEARYAREVKQYLYRMGLAGLASMQVMMCAIALYMDLLVSVEEEFLIYFKWISLLLSTPVMIYSAQPFYVNAWRGLKQRHLSMDLSVSLALISAFLASAWATVFNTGEVYYDSITMFVFFLLLGRLLELRARRKASESGSNLARQVPLLATRLNAAGDEELVVAKQLQAGDRIRVLAGATLPADGVICEGQATLNEAMLTGEHLPVLRQCGELVYAGTITTDSPLLIDVTAPLNSSRIARIVQLQDSALADKPTLAVLADILSRYFIAALLVIAALVWGFWHLHDPARAFWVTLSVLVATCPCALALATPTALTSATARLTRSGVLLRRGHVLDVLPDVDRIVLDKTGTLTTGAIRLVRTCALTPRPLDELTTLAATLEARSEHPIARAFHGLPTYPDMEDYQLVVGAGVTATLAGHRYQLGSARWLGVHDDGASELTIWLAEDGLPIARFVLEDSLRPEAASLVHTLQAAQVSVTLLTGDSSAQAALVAKQLGVDELVQGASPDDKLAYLKARQKAGEITLMLGDGVNDAPVLAGAHVSFAMAGGTDLAKNSADAILLGDDLHRLLEARRIARLTRHLIRQNFAWSLGYNLLVLPLAACGWLPPYLAAAGMSLSSLVVVFNSMRLGRL